MTVQFFLSTVVWCLKNIARSCENWPRRFAPTDGLRWWWPRTVTSSSAWQHPWLRVQRLIRSILEVRLDPVTRSVMKQTLREAVKEREKIRRAGWFS